MSDAHDLSGAWAGIFSYPDLLPPTRFEAMLRDHDGAITGETAEPDHECPGQMLYAVLEGKRQGHLVRFTKTYDDLRHAADVVHYQGAIQADGDEIEGRWEIPGIWSGSFLMIRGSRATEAAREEVGEEA